MALQLFKTVVAESQHSTQLVDLTLKEVIDAGKVTNPYQLFVLGHLSTFFKNGLKSVDLNLENPISFNTDATSSALKAEMLKLSDAEHAKLAQYLLDCIKAGESMLHNQAMSSIDWVNFVLRKQN